MKQFFLLTLLVLSSQAIGQDQFNNFENSYNLDIQFGEDSLDSIWQIGTPQKALIDSAYSLPNVLITDTIQSYGLNLNSSFTVAFDEFAQYGFPFIQIEWFQKTDLEDGVDGGVIEASYDEGQSWTNVFDDPIFRPDIVGSYQWDTLYDGQAGITGVQDWEWMAICWGSNTGTLPSDVTGIQVRFTMISDSVDTNQEGWAFDDFIIFTGNIIGNNSDLEDSNPISIYPNPSHDLLNIDLSNISGRQARIEIFDSNGRKLYAKKMETMGMIDYELNLQEFPVGVYFLSIKTDVARYHQKFVKKG